MENENKTPIKQIFLIMCDGKNNILKYINLFKECGDYKIVFNNSKKGKFYQFACVNTIFSFEEIKTKIQKITLNNEYVGLIALTQDMINKIDDEDLRSWCLYKINENLINNLSKENINRANKFVNELNKELDSVINERKNNSEK